MQCKNHKLVSFSFEMGNKSRILSILDKYSTTQRHPQAIKQFSYENIHLYTVLYPVLLPLDITGLNFALYEMAVILTRSHSSKWRKFLDSSGDPGVLRCSYVLYMKNTQSVSSESINFFSKSKSLSRLGHNDTIMPVNIHIKAFPWASKSSEDQVLKMLFSGLLRGAPGRDTCRYHRNTKTSSKLPGAYTVALVLPMVKWPLAF